MTTTQDILRVGHSVQAAALAGESLKVAKKKKKTSGDFLKLGVTNIVGTNLIKSQAQIVGTL